jgi:20S proteasome alpha/beta subunit
MTTVTYRDGILAADSRCSISGWKQSYYYTKMRMISDGSICAITGEISPASALIDWIERGGTGNRPNLGDNSRVIRMMKNRRLTIYEGEGSFEIECEFTAFGSGAPPALAAMYMGADARKAVEIAAMVDDGTGGEIHTMSCG